MDQRSLGDNRDTERISEAWGAREGSMSSENNSSSTSAYPSLQ